MSRAGPRVHFSAFTLTLCRGAPDSYQGPAVDAGHWSCGSWQNDVIWLNRYVQRGFMCSTLRSNGVRLTSVCHNIY